MTKQKKIISLMLLPLILTSCGKKITSQEAVELADKFNANAVANCPKEFSAKAKITYTLLYKEGEFFSESHFALAIIVPLAWGSQTWKADDGKYYRKVTEINSKKSSFNEITKDQFDYYMEAHKTTVLKTITDVCQSASTMAKYEENKDLIPYQNATVEANYKSANEEHLVENVIVTYKDNDERQHILTNNFTFKKGLPVQHKTTEKIDDTKTETVYKYTYSKVKFSAPSTEGATPLA